MEMGLTIIFVTLIVCLHDYGIKWLDYKKWEISKRKFEDWLKED